MYVLGIVGVLLLPLGLFALFPGSTIGSSAVAIVLGMVATQKAWKRREGKSWRKNDWTPRWLGAIVGGPPSWTGPMLHRRRRNRVPLRAGDVLPAIQLALGAAADTEAAALEVARLGSAGSMRQ